MINVATDSLTKTRISGEMKKTGTCLSKATNIYINFSCQISLSLQHIIALIFFRMLCMVMTHLVSEFIQLYNV